MTGEAAAKGGVPRSWDKAITFDPGNAPFLGGNGGVQKGLDEPSGNFDGPFMFGNKPVQNSADAAAFANAGVGQQEYFNSRSIASKKPVVLEKEVQDVELSGMSAVKKELDNLLLNRQEEKQPVPIADVLLADNGQPVFVSNTGNANRRPIWEENTPRDAHEGSSLVTDKVSAGVEMQPPIMKAPQTPEGGGNFAPEPPKRGGFLGAISSGLRSAAKFMKQPIVFNINGSKDQPVYNVRPAKASATTVGNQNTSQVSSISLPMGKKGSETRSYAAAAEAGLFKIPSMEELRTDAAARAAERATAEKKASEPAAEPIQIVDETPVAETVSVAEEAPVAKEAPVVKETPVIKEAPKVNARDGGHVEIAPPKAPTPPEPVEQKAEAPAAKEAPAIKEAPKVNARDGGHVEIVPPKVNARDGGHVEIVPPKVNARDGGHVEIVPPKVNARDGGYVEIKTSEVSGGEFPAWFSSPKVGKEVGANPRRNNVSSGEAETKSASADSGAAETKSANAGSDGFEAANASGDVRSRIETKVETNIREKIKARGGKVLGATKDIYLMATDGISKEEAKKEAAAAAYRQLREYDIATQAAKDKRRSESNERLKAAGKKPKGMIGSIADSLKPWNIAKNFVERSRTVVERAVLARQSYVTALEAIEQTGKRSSGHVAAELAAADRTRKASERMMKPVSERLKDGFASVKKFGGMDVRDVASSAKDAVSNLQKNRFKNRKNAIVGQIKNSDTGGKLDERIFDALSDDYAINTYGLADPDRAMVDRAIQARKAGGFNQDKGVEVKEQAKDNELSRAMKAFAVKVAGFDDTVDMNTDRSEESMAAFKAEMAKRDAARKEITEVVNKHLGGTMNNAGDVVRLIERNLKGALREELKDPQQHKEAVKAIEDYIDEHFHFDKFNVKDTGLAMSEKGYANFVDKMAIGNVGIAIAIGLGGAYASGIIRSTAVQQITNSQVVTAAAKVTIAAGLGATRGIMKTKREQMRDNIDAALGLEVKKTKGRTNFDSIMLDVSKTIKDFEQGMDDLVGEHGINKTVQKSMIKQIGEILARNELQEKKKGKVNLFRYSSKDKVERGKADMYKAMNAVMEKLRAGGMSADEIEAAIKASQAESLKGLEQSYGQIKKEQLSERYKKGARDGAIAGSAAVLAVFAMDLIRGNGRLINEIRDLRGGSKQLKMEGWHLNVVDTGKTDAAAVGAGVVAERAAARQRGNQSSEVAEKEGVYNREVEVKKEAPRNFEQLTEKEDLQKPVLFETAENGGQAIGIDRNNNGTIEASEYICGTSKANGLNLARENDLNNMRIELEDRGFRMETADVTTQYAKGSTLETYMNTKVSVRKDVKIDEWQQTYEMSNNITRVPGDGEGLFRGRVKVLNGKEIPDGTKVLYDPDGDGPLGSVELSTDKEGYFYVPEELAAAVDGDNAKLAGICRVVNEVDGKLICGTTNKSGLILNANTEVSMSAQRMDRVITIYGKDSVGKEVANSQFAVDLETGEPTSNYSEILNGRKGDNMAYFMQEDENAGVVHIQGTGEVKQRVRSEVPYDERYDSNLNDPFKGKNQYVTTPNTLDADGDGVISAMEAEAYYMQTMNKIGTDPQFMMEQADQFGVLKPENMQRIGFTADDYARLGIADGQIDTREEINLVIKQLKESGNADLLKKFTDGTNLIRGEKLDGCMMEEITIYDRVATYSKNGELQTISASTGRKAVVYYRLDENGNKVYVEYEGVLLGKDYKGPATDILACGQTGKKKQPPKITTTTTIRTTSPPTTTEMPSTTPEMPPEPKKPMPTEQPGEGDGKLPPTTTLPPGSPTSAPGPTTERPKMPSR